VSARNHERAGIGWRADKLTSITWFPSAPPMRADARDVAII
jgi:hypothetical protein